MTDISLLPKDKRRNDKKDHTKREDHDFVFSVPKEKENKLREMNTKDKFASLNKKSHVFSSEKKEGKVNTSFVNNKTNKPLEKKEDFEIKDLGNIEDRLGKKKAEFTEGKIVRDTIDVSLVENRSGEFKLDTNKKITIMVVTFIFMAFIGLAAYLFYSWKISDNEQKIEIIRTERASDEFLVQNKENLFEKEEKIVDKISQANFLLEEHGNSLKIFDYLEEKTVPEIYYTDIVFDGETNLVSLGVISPDYLHASQQIKTFENDSFFVEKVDISGLATEETKVLRDGVEGKLKYEETDYEIEKSVSFNIQLTFKEGQL
jgi:hypothetical protein